MENETVKPEQINGNEQTLYVENVESIEEVNSSGTKKRGKKKFKLKFKDVLIVGLVAALLINGKILSSYKEVFTTLGVNGALDGMDPRDTRIQDFIPENSGEERIFWGGLKLLPYKDEQGNIIPYDPDEVPQLRNMKLTALNSYISFEGSKGHDILKRAADKDGGYVSVDDYAKIGYTTSEMDDSKIAAYNEENSISYKTDSESSPRYEVDNNVSDNINSGVDYSEYGACKEPEEGIRIWEPYGETVFWDKPMFNDKNLTADEAIYLLDNNKVLPAIKYLGSYSEAKYLSDYNIGAIAVKEGKETVIRLILFCPAGYDQYRSLTEYTLAQEEAAPRNRQLFRSIDEVYDMGPVDNSSFREELKIAIMSGSINIDERADVLGDVSVTALSIVPFELSYILNNEQIHYEYGDDLSQVIEVIEEYGSIKEFNKSNDPYNGALSK